jgi:hypothetical protein
VNALSALRQSDRDAGIDVGVGFKQTIEAIRPVPVDQRDEELRKYVALTPLMDPAGTAWWLSPPMYLCGVCVLAIGTPMDSTTFACLDERRGRRGIGHVRSGTLSS